MSNEMYVFTMSELIEARVGNSVQQNKTLLRIKLSQRLRILEKYKIPKRNKKDTFLNLIFRRNRSCVFSGSFLVNIYQRESILF